MHSEWDENMRMIMTSSDFNEDADSRYYMLSPAFPKEFRKVATLEPRYQMALNLALNNYIDFA
jgi:hypothetical protein